MFNFLTDKSISIGSTACFIKTLLGSTVHNKNTVLVAIARAIINNVNIWE